MNLKNNKIEPVLSFQFDIHNVVSLNKIYAGTHWAKRKKYKDDMMKTLFFIKTIKVVNEIKYPVTIEFNFSFKKNALDSSNCSYMSKIIEDCIVQYGILENDSVKNVQKIIITSDLDKNLKKNLCSVSIFNNLV